VTIVSDAEITLLEDTKLGIDLQDVKLAVTNELGLDREPRLTSDL
jgi:hypothetical protein